MASTPPNVPPDQQLPLLVVERAPNSPAIAKRRFGGVARGLLLLVLAVIVAAVVWRTATAGKHPPQVAANPLPDRVVGLGTVLPQSGVVTVAMPYGAGDARIASLKVHEGDRVKAGDVIGVLDNERVLTAVVAAARAQVAVRKAMRVQVGGSVRASRGELRAQLARSKVASELAAKELERATVMYEGGAIAAQEFDRTQAGSAQAKRDVARLRASISRYGKGPIAVQADAVVASRNLEAAKADLERALADLDKAYVRAPIGGTILKVHAEPGEKPGQAGVVDMGDLERMKVEVEVYQTHIRRVAVGNSVRIEAPALPEALTGSVSRIGLEVGRQQRIDDSPAALTDARVVLVTVSLDEAGSQLARQLSNLQVTATFDVAAAP